MKVLVVEDESTTRTLLAEILRSRGHEVRSCPTAEAGWEAFDADGYDLVLLNWMLPVMSGLDLCRRLRADPRGDDTIILVITGRNEPGALEAVLDAGADDYVSKPLDVRLLRVRLQIAEKRVRHQQAMRAAEREQRRLELTMQHAQKLESLGVLAGGIAHDFNNLLVGILGYTHLAMMDVADEKIVAGHLAKIETATTRASELTSQLLAYSGRGNLRVETVDLNDVAPAMASLLEVSRAKGAKLEYALCDQALPVLADATQLRQVILNLVTNASDAIGEDTGTIRVSTGTTVLEADTGLDELFPVDVRPGPYAYVEVEDTGCGMDPDTRERIFDPFFTTKDHGRGLGLAAALGIVRSHRGGLRVRSRPGHGTSIRLLLPLDASRTVVPSGEEPLAGLGAWRGQGTVLVIDEDESVRSVATQLLTRLGFQVVCAGDVDAGLEKIKSCRESLAAVMVDATLSGAAGERVLDAMDRVTGRLPLVVCSATRLPESSLRAGPGRGPVVILRKPFVPADLAEAFRAAVDQPATA